MTTFWFLLAAGCRGPDIGLGSDPVKDNVLARRIQIRKRKEDGGRLRCAADVEDEIHEVPLPKAEFGGEEVFLAGLLADTTYECTVIATEDTSEVISFTTDPLPRDLPRAELVEDGPGGGAYLVMNHGTDDREDRRTKILVYDDRGRLRHYYWVPFSAPDLDVHYLGDGTFLYGGGYAALPTLVNLEGEQLLQAPGTFEPGQYNHTVERVPDGRYMTTEGTRNTHPSAPGLTWNGFSIEFLTPDMEDRAYALSSQELVNLGQLPVASSAQDGDPYHLNALQYFGDENEVAASLYREWEIIFVDLAARVIRDRIGVNADWSLVDADGEPLGNEDWFFGQHAVEILGDRMLLHDNGAGRPSSERYSRAVEYELDWENRTATLVWEWTEDPWYETIWGDVDRIGSDRVGITHAHCEKCTDVGGQRTEVLVVDRASADVDWRLRFSDPHDASYRSEWIDGCDLFHRTATCPER